MDVRFEPLSTTGSGTLVVLVDKAGALPPMAVELDAASSGLLARALELAPPPIDRGQVVDVVLPAGQGAGFARVLAVGAGAGDELDETEALAVGAAIARVAAARQLDQVTVLAEVVDATLPAADLARAVASGLALRSYRFDELKSATDEKPELARASILTSAATELGAEPERLQAVVEGVHLCRDLVNRPANKLDTNAFAAAARALEAQGVEVEVLDRKALGEIGMGALLGVAQGSAAEPYVALMRWHGAGDDGPPLALLGKGVVFDSGGLSLKPAKSMETMKIDMAGAACVIGTMHTLARRRARANVIGAVGIVENMPSGSAQRPGDVVTSLSGKTIEVLNTDAEGRLVLADVLWYVQDRFKPSAMIDFATLTGAIIVSLGYEYAGLFANDDALAEKIRSVGSATGETVWPMPLGAAYHKQLESTVADMRNIGRPGQAGAITAACFLEKFVNEVPWAHIDLAATSYVETDDPLAGKGATGWGVRLVDRLVAEHYEG